MRLVRMRVPVLGLSLAAATAGQPAEFSVMGGYGWTQGDDQRRTGGGAAGVSLGWPAYARHKLQFDYAFTDHRNRPYDRRFVTGSWVLQGRESLAFVQIGAGLMIEKQRAINLPTSTDASFAVSFGAGVTVNVTRSLFVRPQVRSYLYVGPTLTVLPGLAIGWRF